MKDPRCATCLSKQGVLACVTCGDDFCARHGQLDRCNACWYETLLPPAEVNTRWSTVGLALCMVAVLSALGVLLGDVLETVIVAIRPGVPHGAIAAAMAIVGFGLGWWCFATVGHRWIADDQREAELEQEE
jgi:hypothetical protein